MAWSSPRTWTTGELVTAAMLNQEVRDNLLAAFPLGGVDGAWTGYTPTLTQNVTVTKTVTYARYTRSGRLILAECSLAVTSSGTAANNVSVTLPVTAAQGGNLPVGSFYINDASATTFYSTPAEMNGTGSVYGIPNAGANALGSTSFTAALASGDTVGYMVAYEAAT